MDIQPYYLDKGRGRPLVLLHGNGESCEYFAPVLDRLAADYRVIAPDTRGHGRTPRGGAPFTIRQFAEDLRALLDQLGLERVHLLGFSDGANIAMIFAMRYPERVDRLILDGGNLDTRGVKPGFQIPIEIGYRCARVCAAFSAQAARKAELLGLMVLDPRIGAEELKAIRAETLVMAGTDDLIREEHTRAIAAAIPGAELEILPGGHCLCRDNPREFERVVLEFLGR